MTIAGSRDQGGVDVHLDADECELFMQLALDAEKATYHAGAGTYLSLSLQLGKKISALVTKEPQLLARGNDPGLASRMRALILSDDFPA